MLLAKSPPKIKIIWMIYFFFIFSSDRVSKMEKKLVTVEAKVSENKKSASSKNQETSDEDEDDEADFDEFDWRKKS